MEILTLLAPDLASKHTNRSCLTIANRDKTSDFLTKMKLIQNYAIMVVVPQYNMTAWCA